MSQAVSYLRIVQVFKISVPPCIEQVVSCRTYYLVLILYLLHLVIIEFKPRPIIFGIGCVMTSKELSIVIGDPEEIVNQGLTLFLLPTDYEIFHIQTL